MDSKNKWRIFRAAIGGVFMVLTVSWATYLMAKAPMGNRIVTPAGIAQQTTTSPIAPDATSINTQTVSVTATLTETKHNQNQFSKEIASWNSYTFHSADLKDLPDISFKYPSSLKIAPTITSHDAVFNDSHDDRVLLLNFSKDLPIFADVNEPPLTFEEFAKKVAKESDYDSPKYFLAGALRVARARHASPEHYDGDVGLYFIELPNKNILMIDSGYSEDFLYNDDQNGMSTIDKIISTISVDQ